MGPNQVDFDSRRESKRNVEETKMEESMVTL